MSEFLLHLWARPPQSLAFTCPPPPPGEAVPPPGYFDPANVAAAFSTVGIASLIAIIGLVLACYLLTRSSLGPGFVRRWWIFLVLAAGAGLLLPVAVLRLWPTRALTGSCVTDPNPFRVTLPWSEIMDRGLAGALWGVLAFVLLSLLFTQLLGRTPLSGGFFHNRGCPWPRWR